MTSPNVEQMIRERDDLYHKGLTLSRFMKEERGAYSKLSLYDQDLLGKQLVYMTQYRMVLETRIRRAETPPAPPPRAILKEREDDAPVGVAWPFSGGPVIVDPSAEPFTPPPYDPPAPAPAPPPAVASGGGGDYGGGGASGSWSDSSSSSSSSSDSGSSSSSSSD